MNKVGIVGLGLIGGSMAKAVKKFTSCKVCGLDRNPDVFKEALNDGTLDSRLDENQLRECDLLIVALYPAAVVSYLKENADSLKKDCVVVDCTGVKKAVCNEVSSFLAERGIRFIGGHPMAGIEHSGYQYAFAELFKDATMILCYDEYTDETAFQQAAKFFLQLGFARIRRTTAEEHDSVIAYTSQMAHIVSSAYIKSETLSSRYGFSAGSFKDLTRVAKLNETMWTELFMDNRECLLKELDTFIDSMEAYRQALQTADEAQMRTLLADGRTRKEADEQREQMFKAQIAENKAEGFIWRTS